ncbi:MAG: hypothetical protein AAF514_06770 [Verrucomicrobiota bacterium]
MKMPKPYLKAALVGLIGFTAPTVLHAEGPEAGSPSSSKVLLALDFEDHSIDSPVQSGQIRSVPDEGMRSGTIKQTAGNRPLSDKGVVVSEGLFYWETDEIPLANPIMTTASVDLTLVAGPGGFHPTDRVRVYARLDDHQTAPRPLLNIAPSLKCPANEMIQLKGYLPVGALAEIQTDTFPYTTLKEPSSMRLVVELESRTAGNYMAIDNLIVQEETTMVEPFPSVDRNAAEPTFSYDQTQTIGEMVPSLELYVDYRAEDLPHTFDNLTHARLCLGSSLPWTHGDFDPIAPLSLTDNPETGLRRLAFTMDRPENGWIALKSYFKPRLFFCRENGSRSPIDQSDRLGRWGYLPVVNSRLGAESVSIDQDRWEPLKGDEPYADIPLTVNVPSASDLPNLEGLTVGVRYGASLYRTEAELQDDIEISEGGRRVRFFYRITRPEFGWPPGDLGIRFDLEDRSFTGCAFFLKVVPGRSSVRFSLPKSDRLPPGRAGDPDFYDQFILASEETFRLKVDYESEVPIDLSTIGDGDVLYDGDPVQEGRLVSIEPSNDHRHVRATFEFERDLFGVGFNQGSGRMDLSLRVVFPPGSVANVEGGGFFGEYNLTGWPTLHRTGPDLRASLMPSGSLNPDLSSHRFTVVYESADGAILANNLEAPHLLLIPEPSPGFDERFTPEITGYRTRNDGERIRVDYRVPRPENGWPESYRLRVIEGSLRSDEGGSVRGRQIGMIGKAAPPTTDWRLISGQTIEGDPDTHRLSFFVQQNSQFAFRSFFGWNAFAGPQGTPFDGAYAVLGDFTNDPLALWKAPKTQPLELSQPGMYLPIGYEEGPFSDRQPFTGIVNLEIDRPEGGWGRWGGSVPYVIQAPLMGEVPNSVIARGNLPVLGATAPGQPRYRFNEWLEAKVKETGQNKEALMGDFDGDGLTGLAEFALGTDVTRGTDTPVLTSEIVTDFFGKSHLYLNMTLRSNAMGLSGELQYSEDGRSWNAADDVFEILKRTPVGEERQTLRLRSKKGTLQSSKRGLFRLLMTH